MTSISSALFKFFKARQMVEFNVIFRANKLAAGCSGAVTSTTRCGRVRNYSGIYWLEVCPFVRLSSCVDTVNIIIYLGCLWGPKLRWSFEAVSAYFHIEQPSPAQPSPGRRWAEHRQWSPEPVLPCPKIFYWKIFKIKGLTLTARFPWIILEVWVLTVFDIPPFLKYFWT